MDVDWQADLDRWLAPFVAALRHKTRARMCPAYIAGLIGPGDRKSVQPMAARAGEVGYDQLHHFVAAGVWDSAPLEAALLKKADGLVPIGADGDLADLDARELSAPSSTSIAVSSLATAMESSVSANVKPIGRVAPIGRRRRHQRREFSPPLGAALPGF
jgi:hypothetical protein